MTRSCLPACLRAPHHMAGTHAMRRASGIRTRTGSRHAMAHGIRAKPTERQRLEAVKAASHACMPLSWILPSGSFLGPWRSRRDGGRGLCRVPAVPRRGCERQAREQAGTGTCAPTPAASGRQATQGAHSLRLLSAARPTSNRSSRPPPHPHPPLSSSPCSRSAARVVPSHHCRLLQRHHHHTPSDQTPRHSSGGERERGREAQVVPLLHAFCPVASRALNSPLTSLAVAAES